jgi:hypothetical protein
MEESDELTSKTTGAVYAFRFKGFMLLESELVLTNLLIEEKMSSEELAITAKQYMSKVEKFTPVYCLLKEYAESDGGSSTEKPLRVNTAKPQAFIFQRKDEHVVSEYYNYFINGRKIGSRFSNYSVSIVDI